MAYHKTKEQISYNMRRVHNSRTTIENLLCDALENKGITGFTRNDNTIFGKPDIAFHNYKLAVFCDGDYWHGYDWDNSKDKIKTNREFWINKIEKTMSRDAEVTIKLQEMGWDVLRFWGHEIKKDLDTCINMILDALCPTPPYRMIDLCAGIGGIRKGFELTGHYINVLSAENDKHACETYKHLFGENPFNDVRSSEFKEVVKQTPYDILLTGFPCQTFSSVGRHEGFENEEKGKIFFDIAEIIDETRPCAFFLENVERLVTHDHGETFKRIIQKLVIELNYYVIGITYDENGLLKYDKKSFVRNSRNFGVPQNRPRTYIVGFDSERFPKNKLEALPKELPHSRDIPLYEDLNAVLEHDVEPRYYMSSGYLETLIKHRERQEKKGYGFGYRIVNDPSIEHPIANTLLATGGSGRERNLIYDPKDGVAGMEIKGRKTKLNDRGIRIMTPSEWGKLQGFINYAFIDSEGCDDFSFPPNMPDSYKYQQFGNAVTIPVIEEMAKFIYKCLNILIEK